MLVPACGSRCAREGASSEVEPAQGRRGPSSEADLARGGALLGRSSGPRGPSRRGLCCVRTFCVMFEVCLCFVFFAGFKQDSPRFFRGPSWLSPTRGTQFRQVRAVRCEYPTSCMLRSSGLIGYDYKMMQSYAMR
jgi:hypothetical protein